MQKTFKNQQGREILITSTQENARNFEIKPHPINPLGNWLWWYQGKVKTGLPIDGNYQILCLAKDATEEQIQYILGNNEDTDFKLLFRHLGFKQDDNVIILEKI